jgi:hypothetical protein
MNPLPGRRELARDSVVAVTAGFAFYYIATAVKTPFEPAVVLGAILLVVAALSNIWHGSAAASSSAGRYSLLPDALRTFYKKFLTASPGIPEGDNSKRLRDGARGDGLARIGRNHDAQREDTSMAESKKTNEAVALMELAK